jgi:hypothetical protein
LCRQAAVLVFLSACIPETSAEPRNLNPELATSKLEVLVDDHRRVIRKALRKVDVLPPGQRGKTRRRQVVVDATKTLQISRRPERSFTDAPRPRAIHDRPQTALK